VPARWAVQERTPLDPQPVQLGQGDRDRANAASVAEPSTWAGNICAVTDTDLRAAALAEYAVRLASRPDLLARARLELAGRDLGCSCPAGLPCHRDILIDYAQPPADPVASGGRALAVTVPRPWASLAVLPGSLSENVVHSRSWSIDYRGAMCILAGNRLDHRGVEVAAAAGFDADWHAAQTGWLGAAVLVDVHAAKRGCCPPWGAHRRRHRPLYHWVFRHGARLSCPVRARGFLGLRTVSWSVLTPPVPSAATGHRPPVTGQNNGS
jgi:hypothetical protein